MRRWARLGRGSVASPLRRCYRHVGSCAFHSRRFRRNLRATILYGIASAVSDDIEDWYPSRDEAEAVVASIFGDEPDFEGELRVEAISFEQSVN